MLKKSAMFLSVLGIVSGFTLVAAPAHAAVRILECDYDNANVPRVGSNSNLTVVTAPTGDRDLTIYMKDPNAPDRHWLWSLTHNGIQTDIGDGFGTFTDRRTMNNYSGADTYRIHLVNQAGTVTCHAKITL